MVFSSASFLFYFLPIVLALYFASVRWPQLRNWVLLAASLFFYTWGEGEYVIVMLLSIVANYLFGISPLSIGTVGAILNFVAAFVVSSATEEPPKHVQELVESIRVPRGAAGAVAH